ncbi:hypothetical protein GGD57_005260 [Rhizobium esperanzae]|uniref:Uncharacterized protein n=1 Tax=Rhizobium esperanzae TaxID=1967781 RepID=A0A7W6W7T9_9HYPH|nr:hypothetical protein [Rhizobium esperanzae]
MADEAFGDCWTIPRQEAATGLRLWPLFAGELTPPSVVLGLDRRTHTGIHQERA